MNWKIEITASRAAGLLKEGVHFMPKVPHSVLAQLEQLLIAAIPKAVKAATIDEPVYCLRIWYNGTDSPSDAVPYLMLVKESTRQQFLTRHSENAEHYLWCADEATNPGQAYNIEVGGEKLLRLYRKWYEYLCDVEDDKELQPFREMVQRVAQRLNGVRWQDFATVTDDFVVFPADGAHTFCDDYGDMVASISADQLAILRAKGLISKGRKGKK